MKEALKFIPGKAVAGFEKLDPGGVETLSRARPSGGSPPSR